ncbi:putative membrane protein [Candidatus Methanophagaceae archaeon]|nr:putative membrane protein [Methanophagales archaeon]
MIKRLFEDQKFSHTFLPPIGLILCLMAISLLFNLSNMVLGLILAVIGIYTLLKGIGRENVMMEFVETLKQSLYSGRISFVTYICALVLIIAGTFQGITESWDFFFEYGPGNR